MNAAPSNPSGLNVSPAFANVLRSEREPLNSRFTAQFHLNAEPDGQAFLRYLAEVIDPIVEAVDRILPECTRSVGIELFDLSLQLWGANVIGPAAGSMEVSRVWTTILPRVPRLLARDAAVVAGLLTNAAHNISQSDDVRFEFWLTEMVKLTADCDSVSRLLDCGCGLAWRAGMVLYRDAALQAVGRLPDSLAARTLGLSPDTSHAVLQRVIAHVRRSPWHALESAHADRGSNELQVVRIVGDFRGFGGAFLQPPRVTGLQGDLIVRDGTASWRLVADCYGHILQRIDSNKGRTTSRRNTAKIDKRGQVTWNQSQATFPELAAASSCAGNSHTLAVTLDDSHRVFLLAVV